MLCMQGSYRLVVHRRVLNSPGRMQCLWGSKRKGRQEGKWVDLGSNSIKALPHDATAGIFRGGENH